MCVKFTTEIRRTKRKRIAYKVVRRPELIHTIFFSQWQPYNRLGQTGYRGRGANIHYKIGEMAESDMDKTPGIFMYTKERSYFRSGSLRGLLKMEIPEGTRYRMGREKSTERPVICAEKAIPTKELR